MHGENYRKWVAAREPTKPYKTYLDAFARRMIFTLTIATLLGFSALTLPATIWSSWRGPSQDNISPESKFPVKWSREENVKWRAPLPAAGNSSPIVWGDTVFVTQVVNDGKEGPNRISSTKQLIHRPFPG